MGILDKFLGKVDKPEKKKEAPKIMINKLSAYGIKNDKKYIQRAKEGYESNAIVHRCIQLIANSASAVDLDILADDTKLDNHELISLLKRPNPQQSGVEFFSSLYSFLLISGNSYILRDTDAVRPPKELYLLRPDRINIIPSMTSIPKSYEYSIGGQVVSEYAVDQVSGFSQVKQIKLWSPTDDYYGLSPIQASAYNIDQHNLAGIHNVSLLKNGATPSGMLQFQPTDETGQSTMLTDEQRSQLLHDLENRFQGTANSGRPMLLEGQFAYTQMGLSPKDMDFLQLLNLSAREIALCFGVPAQLIGIPEANTYSNMETAKLALYEETIIPLLKRVESDLNEYLSPLYDGKIHLRYDLDSIPAMSEKRKQIYENVQGAVTAGIITRNEARERLGLEKIDGADELYIPANLFPIGETVESPEEGDADANEKDYDFMYGTKAETSKDVFTTEAEARARAKEIGCVGTHTHKDKDGNTVYMPCRNHQDYINNLSQGEAEQYQAKQTNFPKRGDDKAISLRNSEYDVFDPEFAENIRKAHPDIWKAGGNIEGNRSYRLLQDFRAGSRSDTVLQKVKEREAWSARHFRDGQGFASGSRSPNLSNVAGVVAQMKWLTVGTLGQQGMKDVIMELVKKLEGRQKSISDSGCEEKYMKPKKKKPKKKEEEEDKQKKPQVADKTPISGAVRKGIQAKVDEHNDKHGDKKGKRVTFAQAEKVFRRGVGAYKTSPSSIRSGVRSPEQWAYARLNSWLFAVRTGRFQGGKFDMDLLPKDHPLSTKK
tara:strand:- start:1061 stop:3373 length:2313 start_codon:yes stop_codon:yes gene_type:complete